ncbi:prenyltransferase [Salinibaculum rarum]|uniref:prenyltransferase n=1 Tax=Salinibaculum rarum TaxID=3058903 RepID=UPI00265E635E|nr:prenyltransferase [Salinibaculum sp. KK48]
MSEETERLAALAPSEQSLVGYLFWLSRPRFWFYLAGPVVVGVVYAADSVSEFFTPLTVALFAYFLVPANVFLYGVNDIYDADVDEHNPKKSEEGKEVKYQGDAVVVMVVFLLTALGALFVPFLPVEGIYVLALFFALGAEYSAPPLRLKTTPFLDSLSNGLYILPGVLAYLAVARTFPPLLAVAGGWLWTMAMHTFSAVPDIEPDSAAGIQTTATFLGERGALVYCGVCWLAGAALMALVHPFLGGVFAVYPLFVLGIVAADVDIDRAYWWFPVLNTLAGMVLTMAGIWVILYG